MVWLTGTATGFADLWTKVRNHLLNDPTLVGAGENWTEVWTAPDQAVLTAPGFGSVGGVAVAIHRFSDPGQNIYEWRVYCCDDVNALATDVSQHVNVSPQVRILLDDLSLPYWLSASGRRFLLVVKVSNVYEPLYAGCYLPYATPTETPKPLFIGGGAGQKNGSDDPVRWNDAVPGHAAFVKSYSSNAATPSAYVRTPTGAWEQVAVAYSGSEGYGLWPTTSGWDRSGTDHIDVGETESYLVPSWQLLRQMRDAPGGEKPLIPYAIMRRGSAPPAHILGELDGVYRTLTFGNSAESVFSVGADSYIVFANIEAQGSDDLWAVKEA